VRPDRDELERLIICGAFDALCPNRRALLWAVPHAIAWAQENEDGLFRGTGTERAPEPTIDLTIPDFTPAEKAIRERSVLGLDVEQHLMSFERERVKSRGGITCAEATALKPGRRAVVVGNPIRLRFPPTPSGKRVVFFDLEDETGLLNVTCFDATYQRDGHAIVTSPYVTLIGVGQWRDGCTAFLAKRAFAYQPVITQLVDLTEPIPVRTADFLVG
jgi:error-prone DNA polymerase